MTLRKVSKILAYTFIAVILIPVVSFFLEFYFDEPYNFLEPDKPISLYIVIPVMVICFGIILYVSHKYRRCPSCGKLIGGRSLLYIPKHCVHCGAEIDKDALL